MEEIRLQIRELKVSFRTGEGMLQAVRGISLDLRRGETLALVGESGCGKSVTAKAIMGLLPANAVTEGGSIIYEEKDLLKLPEKELNRLRGSRIALVPQDPMSSLDPVMKIGRQLMETMRLKAGADAQTARRRAMQLLEEVGIDEPERRFLQYPFELSGGMRQRVVIACALAGDPEILICDEPTTALDVTVQARILRLIDELKQKRKLSVLFITHDMGVVASVADRIAVMHEGKIVESGSAEEIFYHPADPYTKAFLAASSARRENDPGSSAAEGGCR